MRRLCDSHGLACNKSDVGLMIQICLVERRLVVEACFLAIGIELWPCQLTPGRCQFTTSCTAS